MTGPEVAAGGGIVWEGSQVLVVHRPRYDDWSLPKGKLDAVDAGDLTACAVREVLEETGVRVELGAPAGRTRYPTSGRGGVPATKVVDYWHMRRTGGDFTPNREVDEVRWLPVAAARALLTYDRDRMLLDGVSPGSTPARSVLARYEAAVAEGDVDGVDAVLADDFVAFGPRGEPLRREELMRFGRADPDRSVVRDARVVELHVRA